MEQNSTENAEDCTCAAMMSSEPWLFEFMAVASRAKSDERTKGSKTYACASEKGSSAVAGVGI